MKLQALSIVALTTLGFVDLASAGGCWKQAYGRGVGEVITSCRPGEDKSGALCYPPCKDGYNGGGPVCWQNCPSGFTDTGGDCLKPPAYGRGAGYVIWAEDQCKRETGRQCEKWGALWYPTCKDGFHAFACCVCSPNCPSDMPDIGVSCQKNSYGRGVGTVLTCRPGLEMSGALCYPPCKAGFHGAGPVCWQDCPPGTDECGAMCAPKGSCAGEVLGIVGDVFKMVGDAAAEGVTGGIDTVGLAENAGQTAMDLAKSKCNLNVAFYDVQTPSYDSYYQREAYYPEV